MSVTDHQQARLRWACRRGMLELDLLLLPFVENQYLLLPAAKRELFERLLTYNDQELYNWFIKREQVPDEEIAQIIEIVLRYAQSQT